MVDTKKMMVVYRYTVYFKWVMKSDTQIGINEKKEMAVICYSKTYDKSLSYLKANMTEEEIKQVELDKDFQSRLDYYLIEEREKLIVDLKKFKHSIDEKISYKATMDLARVLYPDFFEASKAENTITVKLEQD